MKIDLKYLQRLFFWLSACLPFAIMAAASANLAAAAPAPVLLVMVQILLHVDPSFKQSAGAQ
jgi:hypothetical protein